MAAVAAALLIFWRQGRAREKERQDDNKIRQLREAEDDRVRRERDEKDDKIRRARELKDDDIRRRAESRIASDKHVEQWKASRKATYDREVRKKMLLIMIWPLIVQTRSRVSLVLNTLRRSLLQIKMWSPDFPYGDYIVGVSPDWQRIDQEIFIFGNDVALAIHEMLAIIKQNDQDIERLKLSHTSMDFKMHLDFLINSKEHADNAIKLLEEAYEKALRVKPKRAIFWARSAKAAASQARKRKGYIKKTESLSTPVT